MKGLAVRQADRYHSLDEVQSDLRLALQSPDDERIAAPAPARPGALQKDTPPAPLGSEATVAADAQAVSAYPDETRFAATIADGTAKTTAANAVTAPPVLQPSAAAQTLPAVVPASSESAAPNAAQQPAAGGRRQESLFEDLSEERANAAANHAADRSARQKAGVPVSGGNAAAKRGKARILIAVAAVLLAVILVFVLSSSGSGQKNKPLEYEIPSVLQNFEFTLNGQTIALPATYDDFLAIGWEADEPSELEQTLSPNSFKKSIELTNGYGTITVYFSNPPAVRSLSKNVLRNWLTFPR